MEWKKDVTSTIVENLKIISECLEKFHANIFNLDNNSNYCYNMLGTVLNALLCTYELLESLLWNK